ncbi:enoyl-CoA hydratase/isomerase family protein [Pelobacter seleniigenes]|uniref:enoyl-CoA hydratase/isomerase family protein n=1 Tax=Pelobacter seleniigenes TaxID=407188 RepID=UPI0004A70E56|nr:enoyl-CoA hydratase-related protein [Pelobacter seleniigenes]
MSSQHLLVSSKDGITTLTINQPQTLNSLSPAILSELAEQVAELQADPAVKVVIITGAGAKAFVAGGDIAAMQPLGPLEAREVVRKAQQLFNAIEFGQKIFIAAINGYALGAGCELALACDIRIAAEGAKLGQPEVKLGIIPGWGGTQRLPRLVGKGKAKELMLTGDMLCATEAKELGLVNQVVPAEQLLDSAWAMAQKIAGKSQSAVRLIKQAVDNGMEMTIDKAFHYEAELFALCFATHDQKEGMQAFLEKRTPTWKDC